MDWDSPTTKKHIAEAKAQGCELLGPGKSVAYRTYRLPCGHESEVQTGHMRAGVVRCPTCSDQRLAHEAEERGCLLLGPGKNCNYRMYQLPCGHEQEIQATQLRNGGFRCQTCFANKLNAEAEARGCELIGDGTNKNSRTYRLPCRHEQVIGVKEMRVGGFRCQTCFDNRLNAEADAQGCVLLGPGKSVAYRTYRLPCGHEHEFQTSLMRKGIFRCPTCLDDKLQAEAKAQRCVLLGPGKSVAYRTYRLPCGHEQLVAIPQMRTGSFRCRACLSSKLESEAKAQGCDLLRTEKKNGYNLYRLKCGHEQVIHSTMMRTGVFHCQTCLTNKLKAEAETLGCELLGAGKDAHYQKYRLPCGHIKELQPSSIRQGFQPHCQICDDAKLSAEADAQGCVLFGPGENYGCRTYRLPCGHEKEIAIVQMRKGTFRCQTCGDYFYTQPSNNYLLHIKVGSDEWLKLGYAKNVDFRITRFGLPTFAEVNLLATKPFNTGKEAREFEAGLHKKYRRKRLRAKDMKEFYAGSGFTECYPVTMIETLLAHFREAE
jgi:hypothetical protein